MTRNHISGLFMGVFLLIAMALSLTGVWICRDSLALRDLPEFLQGKWAANFEAYYNKSLYTYEPSINLWTAMTYAAFREGKDGVLVGGNGWLFTKEEFEYQKGRDEALAENVRFITAVRDYLDKADIKLVVVPVPAKARVYEEHLGRFTYPQYNEVVYPLFIESLLKAGIVASDTLEAMQHYEGDSLFLRTDTHWTPEGAEVAARGAVRAIKIAYPDMKFKEASYITVPGREEEHPGDLMRYVPVASFISAPDLRPDRLRLMETIEGAGKVSALLEDDLFSGAAPDVALVGTSYSADPKWNFAGFLKEALRTDILNAAKEGLGPFETMKTYLDNQAFKKTPPKLIIWEIPERYLTMKYDLRADFYRHEGA